MKLSNIEPITKVICDFKMACVPLPKFRTRDNMDTNREYQKLLNHLKETDAQAHEHLEEEIDIVFHKLKFIPLESRPRVAMISNIRDFSQDFRLITQEALDIAGGVWLSMEDLAQADKVIVVQQDASLYNDLPIALQSSLLGETAAISQNELYIIQQSVFEGGTANNFLRQVEIFAEIVQPKYFIYGHEGEGWVRFEL